MSQLVHIFRKDVRCLRLEMAVLLAATAAFAFTGASQAAVFDERAMSRSTAWMMETYLLPFLWWMLVARLMHAETVPGDGQFWITRPYAWKSLLGAKMLFIALVIQLPMMLADLVIVHAYGFGFNEVLGGLIWTQVLMATVFLLPLAAVCAVTTGFPQLFVVCAAASLAVVGWNTVAPASTLAFIWGPTSWITFYLVALVAVLAAMSILVWQYARRKTMQAWFGGATAALLVLLGSTLMPWTTAFAIQTKLGERRADGSSITVGFDAQRKWLARSFAETNDRMQIELPLQITGAAEAIEPMPEGLTATLAAPDGTVSHSTGDPWMQVGTARDITLMQLEVDRAFYQKIRDQQVTLRGTLYFTLYGNQKTTSIAMDGRSVAVPGVGRCNASRGTNKSAYVLFCASAFRPSSKLISTWFINEEERTRVSSPWLQGRQRSTYAPFPAELNINPVSYYMTIQASQKQMTRAMVQTSEPLAHLKRSFEITGLQLSDFEVRAKGGVCRNDGAEGYGVLGKTP